MRRTLLPLLGLAALAATSAAAQVSVPRTGVLNTAQPVFCVNPATAAVEDCVGGGGGTSNPAAGATGAAVPADGSYTGLNAGGLLKGWTGDANGGGLVAGEGVAGSPAGGVVSVQGVGSGTPVPVSGTFWQTTQPVSGTFWQATQPVSGTFWQTTQPVSIAALPSGAVTNAGTFAVQAAQSGTWTSTVTQATGSNLHVVVDTAPTTAVTGTFWQATQPVSGTFWQSTQPVSIATAPALVASSAIIGKVDIDQTTPGTTNGVSLAELGSTTIATGNGVSGAGTQRVNIASDNTAFPVNATTIAGAVTPVAGTSSMIATGGTAVTMVTGPVKGCYITNPTSATDEGIGTAENAYANPVTTATTTGNGSNVTLTPGQSFYCPAGMTTNVSVNAATSSHKLTVVQW